MFPSSHKPTRRAVLLAAAAIGASSVCHGPAGQASEDPGTETIRPFRIAIPEDALIEMRRRLETARWPDRETAPDSSQGVQLATMREIARYWATDYDWRKGEARLNALPQFVTTIDGLEIHFIHVRSQHANALPLIVTHGWPGSVIEQLKIVEPLTDPTEHGASSSDAFHLVIPSMPGYGFSAKPIAPGWNTDRIARAWDTLMTRLGYTRYVAQGGDWGARVAEALARQAPPGLLGIHTNLFFNIPPDIMRSLALGEPAPVGLSDKEKTAYEQRKAFGLGYFLVQATRPQTIGFGLADSPTGLAAWMIDHDAGSCKRISRLFAGEAFGAITRDDILDNITLYWLTNTGASSARLYWENARIVYKGEVSVPAAFTVFPDEVYRAPKSWVERTYRNLIYFNEVDKGGHFAAWEQPELLSAELRAAFRSLRSDNG